MKCSLQSSDFLKIMKITFVQTLMFAILTTVSLAANVKAQEVLDQKVNLSVDNVNLDEALKKLETAIAVKFIYSRDFVRLNEKVSLESKDVKLGEV